MSERDNLARLIAANTGALSGGQEAADAIIAAGWVPAERLDVLTDRLLVAAYERDALAATVQRVRAALPPGIDDRPEDRWDRGYRCAMREVRDALDPSDPATDTGGEGRGDG